MSDLFFDNNKRTPAASLINKINIEKLNAFCWHFRKLIEERDEAFKKLCVETACKYKPQNVDMRQIRVIEENYCNTPGCHAGWVYLVMSKIDPKFIKLVEAFDYGAVGRAFIQWLFYDDYDMFADTLKDSWGSVHTTPEVIESHISLGLWGYEKSTLMFCDGEAFGMKHAQVFPAQILLDQWTNVLRKLKGYNRMVEIFRESEYVPAGTEITNTDVVFQHFDLAVKYWKMMDISNPHPVLTEIVYLRSKAEAFKVNLFNSPLFIILLDKLNQLLNRYFVTWNFSSDNTVKAYDYAHEMFVLASVVDPIEPPTSEKDITNETNQS